MKESPWKELLIKAKRNILWFLRMLLIGIIFSLASVITFPIAILRFRNTSTNLLFVTLTAPLSRFVLGLKVEFSGLEFAKSHLPAVFVMNHQTALDILLNQEIYPRSCILVVKRALAFVPVFGWLVFAAGNILLQRSNKQKSVDQMNAADLAITIRKSSVWIYPEGTRRGAKGLGDFKKGAFYIAIKNKVPIIPVVASSYTHKLNFSKWRSGVVLVQVLPPIPTEGLTLEDVDNALGRCHDLMKDSIARLDARVFPTS